MSTFYPHANLRSGLLRAWCPSLGSSGQLLIDRSGRSAPGTLTNMAGQDNWQASGSGVALNFDAVNDYVACGAVLPGAFTYSAWCYLRTFGVDGKVVHGGVSTEVYIPLFRSANTTVQSGVQSRTFAGTIPLLKWSHVCVLRQPDNLVSVFIDGVRSTTAPLSVTGTFTLNALGRYAFNTTYLWDGYLDDIRIYDRDLTLAEIRLLASRRGIGLQSVRKRYTLNYPIVTPPNRLYAKASGLWVPGTPKVNKNGFWASYTPTTATYHADAVDWEARVRANGGTASVETLQAVSNFCTEIATAGIRSKLFRVNLFCGDNLQACLVPLYTSPTTGSAPVGGYAVDLNTGFLNSDYMEKGIGTGGLRGNGVAAKKLSTNLYPHDISTGAETGHLGMYTPPLRLYTTSGIKLDTPVSAVNSTATNRFLFDWRGTGGANGLIASWGLNTSATQPTIFSPVAGLILCDRSSTTRLDLYRQGVSVANNTAAQPTYTSSSSFEIFSNKMQNYTSNPLFGYTLGSSLTAAEHVAYSAAWNTFQAALSRSV